MTAAETKRINRGKLEGWLTAAGVVTAVGLLLAVLGPFGTYLNDGPALRAAYWVGAVWIGVAGYAAAFRVVRIATRMRPNLKMAAFGLAALAVSAVLTLVTRIAAFSLWPRLESLGLSWFVWHLQVGIISLVVMTAYRMATGLVRKRAGEGVVSSSVVGSGEQSGGQPAGDELAAFHKGDVIALQMEDHYVRVHRVDNDELVLMPLARAIEAVSHIEGARTHRSWWVARDAVTRIEGNARAMKLHLSNGLIAPVSRRSIAHLRAAGWFDGEIGAPQ